MEDSKEHSINNGMNISIKVYNERINIYKNKLLDFFTVKFIARNDMDLKYEFKKEFKKHLYYNIYQNPSGFLSLINDLKYLKNLIFLIDLIIDTSGDFDLYYNKDEFY